MAHLDMSQRLPSHGDQAQAAVSWTGHAGIAVHQRSSSPVAGASGHRGRPKLGTVLLVFAAMGAVWCALGGDVSAQPAFTVQNQPIGNFPAWSAGVVVHKGDFNGDGWTDLAIVRHAPGWSTVPVALSGPNGFTAQNIQDRPAGEFADRAASSRAQVITGDFNNDGRTDLALIGQSPLGTQSTVLVALSGAEGFITILDEPVTELAPGEFASWAATSGVQVIPGDFNGDGGTDIALVRRTPGWNMIPVALSIAWPDQNPLFTVLNEFFNDWPSEFAGWAATAYVQLITGDFNGDGRTDIALVRRTPGWSTVPVALSGAEGFTIQNRPVGDFASWATIEHPAAEVITGDFNNDGRTDIALVQRAPGWSTVPVALSDANGFTVENWPVRGLAAGQFANWVNGAEVITGNFGGDGGTDIALVQQVQSSGTLPVALSDANGFTFWNPPVGDFATWAATGGAQVITGNFGGDGGTDIALRTPGMLPVALSKGASTPNACMAPKQAHLGVRRIPQQTNMWCWAACGQMVMEYFGVSAIPQFPQCSQANHNFSRTDCCNTPTPSPCFSTPPGSGGSWPDFNWYGFDFQRTKDAALSWDQLRREFANVDATTCGRRPVVFSWHWPQGGGHAMVANGYRTVDGTNLVEINDPLPPNVGDPGFITYDYYVQSQGHHTHWDDFYDIRFR